VAVDVEAAAIPVNEGAHGETMAEIMNPRPAGVGADTNCNAEFLEGLVVSPTLEY
jgi:hypothetical protein